MLWNANDSIRLVGVGTRGIITDTNDKDDSEHFLMRASRQAGINVALRFL
jgi:hypothetical protein